MSNKTNKTNKNKRDARPLGVESWRSYACFRAGVRWRSRNEDEEARRMFLQALKYDENNRGALFNLGTLDVIAKRYDQALRRLNRARDIAMREKDFEKGPVWYKATYQIAATYVYKARHQDDPNPQYSLAKADEAINELMKNPQMMRVLQSVLSEEPAASNERRSKARSTEKREAEALDEFLVQFAPLALILRASIYVEQEEVVKAERIVTFLEPKENELRGNLSYRARYNLACYYSRRGDRHKALEKLEYALERDNNLAGWAGEDPAFENLRTDEASKREFDDLLNEYAAPTASKKDGRLSLAALTAIGETYAVQLEELEITSRDDLVLKAATSEARRALADELGVEVFLVRRWALLADLLRIVGIDAGAVNLLEVADVRSIKDLGDSNPEYLASLLRQVNQAVSLVEQPPSVETVCRWVRDAGSTTLPIVSGE